MQQKSPPPLTRRVVLAVIALIAGLVVPTATAVSSSAAPPPSPQNSDDKFTAEARQTLSEAKTADFWVRIDGKADLAKAVAADSDWDAKGTAVYEALKANAEATQAGVVADLEKAGAEFRTFWITNAVLVKAGTLDLAQNLAQRADVSQIRQTNTYELPKPVSVRPSPQMSRNTVEWGISAINADDMWAQGITGEGITVANIDSGVTADHPALATHYRGYTGGGALDNDYNWFDAAGVCDGDPCDTDDHGSHTMGTMIGDDGAGNQIGVAPGANWIAANGCSSCADADLIASGQWILAPTKADGSDADPTKRPHVVNNSWGSRVPSNDPFMEDVIIAWEQAGIWGAWSNGNSGPACQTSGSPGSRIVTYSAGAFDANGNIASFSGRGPGQDGEIKPNISAPGVNIRSAVADGGYASANGTSMASPHVAGAIALLWSAAPSLVGDIAGTKALLDETAIDVDDTTCGGTADDNPTWGEGKLDVAALIAAAPVGEAGHLAGTVTDEAGAPVTGVEVTAEGPSSRTVTTGDDGTFDVSVSAGDYSLTATAFGYLPATATATVVAGQTATVDLVMTAAPAHAVSGTVTEAGSGDPIAGATLTLSAPIDPATSGADGGYTFAEVPEGTYTMTVSAGSCTEPYEAEVVVDGDETVDVGLQLRSDDFGYFCSVGTDGVRQGTTKVDLSGDEDTATVELPFEFTYYGAGYDTAHLSSNGHVNFLATATAYANSALPNKSVPNAAVYPFWEDLNVDADAGVYTASTTVDGVQAFVIEYRNVRLYSDAAARTNFSVTLLADGGIEFGYGDQTADKPALGGTSATVGIENEAGTVASQYSFNTAAVSPGMSITYDLPPMGDLSGTVTDYNDALPIVGADVVATPADGGDVKSTTTAEDGSYRLLLKTGTWSVTISAANYKSRTKEIIFTDDGQTARFNPKLKTGIAEISAPSFDWIVGQGETRSDTFTITNTGSAPLQVDIGEVARSVSAAPEAPALSVGSQKTLTVNDLPDGATSVADGKAKLAALKKAAAETDEQATNALGLYTAEQRDRMKASTVTPDAEGEVLKSWDAGLTVAWGAGYTGDVWISDPDPGSLNNTQFSTDGAQLNQYDADWGGTWPGDMALDSTTGDLCQVNVGGDNGIHCFDTGSGAETTTLTGSPWSGTSQRGLAYNPVEDVFYIGGWNEGVMYTVAGTTHDTPGETISQCNPADDAIAGIAYNPTSNSIWFVNSALETFLYQISPEDCSTIKTVAWPTSDEGPGAGLAMDATGALWAANQISGEVLLIDVGDPAVSDLPWLSIDPETATIGVGKSTTFTVTVDSSGLEPGVYGANIAVDTGAGRVSSAQLPVTMVVSAYQVGVNAGGGGYTDGSEFVWSADQKYKAGEWGWSGQRADVETTTKAIGGTTDDVLFQSRRTGSFSYTFDDLPAGTYQVDLGFAEFKKLYGERDRLFDVLINGTYELIEEDVAADVGGLYADQHALVIEHTGGDLEIQFKNRRSYDYPIINALKVQERGDL